MNEHEQRDWLDVKLLSEKMDLLIRDFDSQKQTIYSLKHEIRTLKKALFPDVSQEKLDDDESETKKEITFHKIERTQQKNLATFLSTPYEGYDPEEEQSATTKTESETNPNITTAYRHKLWSNGAVYEEDSKEEITETKEITENDILLTKAIEGELTEKEKIQWEKLLYSFPEYKNKFIKMQKIDQKIKAFFAK